MTKSSTTVSPVMRTLSAYIAGAPRKALPATIMERAKHHLLDTLAAMVSGAPLLPGRRAIEYVAALGGVSEACIVGTRVVTSAANAALAERNRCSGPQLLRAIVLGARTVSGRRMADINIQHLTALMLIDGDIDFASSHDAKRVRDPAVLRLRERIEIKGSAALGKTKTTQAIVEITTRNGARLRHHTKAVRGSATNPMSRDDVAAKARELLTPTLGARRAEALIARVWRMERMTDVRQLRPLLQA